MTEVEQKNATYQTDGRTDIANPFYKVILHDLKIATTDLVVSIIDSFSNGHENNAARKIRHDH